MGSVIWVFNGAQAKFPGGVFNSLEKATEWIGKHNLSGILTSYPLNQGVYDWAIEHNLFEVNKESQKQSAFIGGFTTASQEHYHFESGNME